ncbi:MAG: retroviral-like aspartic protease family protein [Roseiarcus sp.]
MRKATLMIAKGLPLIVAGSLFALPAIAQLQEPPAFTAPQASDDASTCATNAGDEGIAACTRMIEDAVRKRQLRVGLGMSAQYGNWTVSSAYENRGVAYDRAGDRDHALADFDEAIRAYPDAPYAYIGRAKVYNENGDHGRALADYRTALRLLASGEPLRAKVISEIAALQDSPAIQVNTAPQASEIPLQSKGGTFVLPIRISNALELSFILDSGADYVTIPEDVFKTLIRTNTINNDDMIGQEAFQLADGSKALQTTFRIRTLKVGDRELHNVTATVAPERADLLLGQSFLSRFKSWSIDNERHVLLLK